MNNKITYNKIGDYYLPNLTLEESKFKNYHLGKYGRIRKLNILFYLWITRADLFGSLTIR